MATPAMVPAGTALLVELLDELELASPSVVVGPAVGAVDIDSCAGDREDSISIGSDDGVFDGGTLGNTVGCFEGRQLTGFFEGDCETGTLDGR